MQSCHQTPIFPYRGRARQTTRNDAQTSMRKTSSPRRCTTTPPSRVVSSCVQLNSKCVRRRRLASPNHLVDGERGRHLYRRRMHHMPVYGATWNRNGTRGNFLDFGNAPSCALPHCQETPFRSSLYNGASRVDRFSRSMSTDQGMTSALSHLWASGHPPLPGPCLLWGADLPHRSCIQGIQLTAP